MTKTPPPAPVPPDNEPTSEDLVAAFLAYAEQDRSWRPDTVRRYTGVLTKLDGIADWTLEDADEWWTSRRDAAPATRDSDLGVVRSFFTWMTRWDHRPDDPTRRLIAPKLEQTVPKYPGRDELAGHLAAAREEGEHAVRRTLALMAYTGARIGECARADWRDVDRESGRIIIHGKGGKERRAALSQPLLDEILPAPKRGRGPIIGSDMGGALTHPDHAESVAYSEGGLQRKVNRWLARHGSDYTCHAFRKRFASMAGKVVPAPALAEAMGWANVNTAQVYVGGGDELLEKMAAAAAGIDPGDASFDRVLNIVAVALDAAGMGDAADHVRAALRGDEDAD